MHAYLLLGGMNSISKVYTAGYWDIQGSSQKQDTESYNKKQERKHQIGNNMPEFWLPLSLKTWLNFNGT